MTIHSIKEIREKYQYSSSDTWYARLVCRKFSAYFTWFFLRTPITPNQVSILMILLGILGGVFLGKGGYLNGLIGALLLQLFLIFDCVDGEIARYKKSFSLKGKFLDLMVNDIVFISVFFGLGLKIFKSSVEIAGFSLFHNPLVIFLGIETIIFFLLAKLSSSYAKKVWEGIDINSVETQKPNIITIIFQIIANLSFPPHIITILTVAAVFNLLHYFLFFYGIFFPLYWVGFLGRKLSKKEK